MKSNKLSQKILKSAIKKNVNNALQEDLNNLDKTSELLPKNSSGEAIIKSKQSCILCGTAWVNNCFKSINKNLTINWLFNDGDLIKKNQEICIIKGNYRSILMGERVALNFLQTMSGTATKTSTLNKLIKDFKAQLFDTRKTIPGLRIAQKYSVLIGGGNNQRIGLFDQILIKENHIKIFGSLEHTLNKIKKDNLLNKIQIEVETLHQFKNALNHGAKNILLDNFSILNTKKAIDINNGKAILEVSGNINHKTIVSYAKTGVDRISVGLITKNVEAIDFSILIDVQN
jgi:nicotinate-nucleotide pyrophosphorylase (carboxylating)